MSDDPLPAPFYKGKPLDKPPNVYVALPTYGGTMHIDTVECLISTVLAMQAKGWGCVARHYAGMSDVVDTRNCILTRWYDNHPDSQYLLMIDHDMVFPWQMAMAMFYADAAVVGCIYSRREFPAISEKGEVNYWTVRAGEPVNEPGPIVNGFQEWKYVGGGVLLIRRDVVTAMLEKFPDVNDFSDPGFLTKNHITRVIGAFNKIVLPDGVHLSEDYSFCWRARECGFDISAAVDWEIGHVGLNRFRLHARSMLGLDPPAQEQPKEKPPREYIPSLDYDQQNPAEIEWLAEQIKGGHSLLEIGSAAGQSLRYLSKHLAPGAKIRAIDLGEFPAEARDLEGVSCKRALLDTAEELRAQGFDVEILFGDSHNSNALMWAREQTPKGGYDLVFLDGDHRFDGVSMDYRRYGPLGKCVALHDIVNEATDVPKFWKELQSSLVSKSFIARDSDMGIGLIDNQDEEVMQHTGNQSPLEHNAMPRPYEGGA
jgi:hypothetical protein